MKRKPYRLARRDWGSVPYWELLCDGVRLFDDRRLYKRSLADEWCRALNAAWTAGYKVGKGAKP